MSSPQAAVIITSYNRAATVGESIRSVLNQSYGDFELCIVDDGSTDDTRAVVEEFLRDGRVRYLHKPNGGQASALNAGIRATTAPFVGFLDSDCRWLPTRLEVHMRALADRPECGVVYGENRWIDDAGRPCEAPKIKRHSGWVTRQLLYDNFVNFNCSLVRRSHLERVGLFDESLRRNPDYDLWLRLSLLCEFAFVPDVLAEYRVGGGRLSNDKEARFASNLAILQSFLAGTGGEAMSQSEKRRAFAGFYVRRARYRAAEGERRAAFLDFARAFTYSPMDVRLWRGLARALLG